MHREEVKSGTIQGRNCIKTHPCTDNKFRSVHYHFNVSLPAHPKALATDKPTMGAPNTRTKPATNGVRPPHTTGRPPPATPAHAPVSKVPPSKTPGRGTVLKAGDLSDRSRSTTGEPDRNMNVTLRCNAWSWIHVNRVGEIPMLSRVTLQGFSVALFGPHLATEGTGCSVHADPHFGACEWAG